MHRRKSSKDSDELVFPIDEAAPRVVNGTTNGITNGHGPPPLRGHARVHSTPMNLTAALSSSQSFPPNHQVHNPPPSAGPLRTSFSLNSHINGNGNGNGRAPPPHASSASPYPTSFSIPIPLNDHGRNRSISGGTYTPSQPSPLSASFSDIGPPPRSTSNFSFPPSSSPPDSASSGLSTSPKQNRRHSRLHSRNLSLYFPRPGSLSATSIIAEDGSQEVEVAAPDGGQPLPSAGLPSSASRSRMEGFTFGSKSPMLTTSASQNSNSSLSSVDSPHATPRSRKGHHHKHSLSHNFFSFLDPGAAAPPNGNGNGSANEQYAELISTTPTPVPLSPFSSSRPHSQSDPTAFSPSPSRPAPTFTFTRHKYHPSLSSQPPPSSSLSLSLSLSLPSPPIIFGTLQFLLGAYLWASGQQVGSLSCTGLGYWIVFDAIGLVLGGSWGRKGEKEKEREWRSFYVHKRMETLLLFAQSVYLMFSAVYVCKETVEHLLLSAGEDGHHHHVGDEHMNVLGINFPILSVIACLLTSASSAILYDNHAKLVNMTGLLIPVNQLSAFLGWHPSTASPYIQYRSKTWDWDKILENPFVLAPISFAAALLVVGGFVPASEHQASDLFLASIEAIVMFKIAYQACVKLGAVLLQTAPERGLAGGSMEAFLRTMREIERHSQILHLPAPHIWQLSSPLTRPYHAKHVQDAPVHSVVVTIELHVSKNMSDADVVELTRWVWERCTRALGGTREAEAEVTVGVVRGSDESQAAWGTAHGLRPKIPKV